MDLLFSIVFVIAILFSLITGKKRTERELGYVAEVCPQCGTARPVKVTRVGMAYHFLYVSLGRGGLRGFSGQCQQCSSVFPVQAMDYAAFDAVATTPFELLIARTNPKLDPESKLALVAYERLAQVREPLIETSAKVTERYSSGNRLDIPTVLAFLVALGLPIFLGYSMPSIPFSIDAALFVIGVAAAFVVFYMEPRRFFHSQLRPELARALRSLDPQRAELEACLLALKQHGDRICKFVTTQSLLQDMSEIAASPIAAPAAPIARPMEDKGPRGQCPNCGVEIALDSLACPNPGCNALFGPGSAWKIKPV